MHLRRLAAVSFLCALVFSCATSSRIKKKKSNYNCSARVTEAIAKFNAKKYADVKIIAEDVKFQCGGHSAMDTALYYLGMALQRSKAPVEARSEFERLIQDFPNSPYAEEARFRIGEAVYLESNPPQRDQTETRESIRLLKDFLDIYPEGPWADSARVCLDKAIDKLAQKEFNNARFYQKNNEDESAVIYYQTLIAQYPQSKYTSQAMLNMAELLIDLNRTSEAREVLEQLIEQDKGDLGKKARALLEKVGSEN